eukprot:scaffold34840_cov63-Phaeocystis_antarctica.AAC.1
MIPPAPPLAASPRRRTAAYCLPAAGSGSASSDCTALNFDSERSEVSLLDEVGHSTLPLKPEATEARRSKGFRHIYWSSPREPP